MLFLVARYDETYTFFVSIDTNLWLNVWVILIESGDMGRFPTWVDSRRLLKLSAARQPPYGHFAWH